VPHGTGPRAGHPHARAAPVLLRLRGRLGGGRGAELRRERDRGVEGTKNKIGGAHYLEGGVEGLQEWRLGGGIWRGAQKWRVI
jgi:hypothetical protein